MLEKMKKLDLMVSYCDKFSKPPKSLLLIAIRRDATPMTVIQKFIQLALKENIIFLFSLLLLQPGRVPNVKREKVGVNTKAGNKAIDFIAFLIPTDDASVTNP